MSLTDRVTRLRRQIPIPIMGDGPGLIRWLLLDGNRYAVTGAIIAVTFLTLLVLGRIWTFEMQQLFTETDSVQTVLNSLLSGIILLVSIVVSTSAIVLSYDITSINTQRQRIREVTKFRHDIGELQEGEQSPTDPAAFLDIMARVLRNRVRELETVVEDADRELTKSIQTYIATVEEYTNQLAEPIEYSEQGEFSVLWIGLETDYGKHMDDLQTIRTTHEAQLSEQSDKRFDELVEAFELFATGREYFKTLYYAREIAQLSRTLLITALPTVLITAWSILAIDSGVMPKVGAFGLPPLLIFLAATVTFSLIPYIVLTAYMLRVATVARQTASGGPFTLQE